VDGRTELVLTPMEFLQRIVTLIPLPRKNCLRYMGVFGANSALRRKIVRRSLQEQLTIFPSEEKKKIKRNRLYLTWAALIRRIFEDDPLHCPCGGEMRIVKFLTEAEECTAYLQSHGLEATTADPKPARSPPGLDDCVDPTPPDDWYGIDPPCSED
jgi:hypothetical protein